MSCMKLFKEQTADGAAIDVCPWCGQKNGTAAKEGNQLPPGATLHGKYLIGLALGWGGFGVTYLGYDATLDRTVAIKEYFPSSFASRVSGHTRLSAFPGEAGIQFQEGLKRFIEEAKRLSKLNHLSGTVDTYDYFEENGTGYIVMEYLDGTTVKELLKRKGAFSFRDARDIIIPILETLDEVHKAGIVHRDIAPDNIFVLKDGSVRLIDFGASRQLATMDQKTLTVILKPGYAPEEQYRSHGEQGPWTDVYAAAATFYKMITGVTPEESLDRLTDDTVMPPSALGIKIPWQAEAAITHAMRVRANERTQSAGEFIREIKEGVFASDARSQGKESPAGPGVRKRAPVTKPKPGGMSNGLKALISCGAVAIVVIALFATGAFGGNNAVTPDTGDAIPSADISGNSDAYEDASDVESSDDDTTIDKPQLYSVGDFVEFGTWREKPIEWRVLTVEDDKMLVISKDVLTERQYDGLEELYGERLSEAAVDWDNVQVTWADSDIRAWLNSDFLNEAFSADERAGILTTKISTPDNEEYGTDGGADTEDKVFLLSVDEANQYFESDEDRSAKFEMAEEDVAYLLKMVEEDWGYNAEMLAATRTDLENRVAEQQRDWYLWWLRSPGESSYRVADVHANGFVHSGGGFPVNGSGVRPALWRAIA